MANLSRYTDALFNLDTPYYWNDFPNYTSAQDGVTTLAATGTAAINATGRSGLVTLTTGAVANQSAGVMTTNALWTLLANKPIYGRALLQYSESTIDDANVMVGFASAPTAAILTDTTGVMRASGTICAIYKLPNTTVWIAHTRNGSTYTETVSTKTAGGTLAQLFEVNLTDWDGVSMMATYRVDGENLRDSNNQVIRHQVLIASAIAMNFLAFVKSPLGTGEVASLDYIYAHQLR